VTPACAPALTVMRRPLFDHRVGCMMDDGGLRLCRSPATRDPEPLRRRASPTGCSSLLPLPHPPPPNLLPLQLLRATAGVHVRQPARMRQQSAAAGRPPERRRTARGAERARDTNVSGGWPAFCRWHVQLVRVPLCVVSSSSSSRSCATLPVLHDHEPSPPPPTPHPPTLALPPLNSIALETASAHLPPEALRRQQPLLRADGIGIYLHEHLELKPPPGRAQLLAGVTPLECAAAQGHRDVLKILVQVRARARRAGGGRV